MQSKLPMHLSPRCGARSRSGSPCQSPAMPNGRCRMHGGKSPGAPRGNKNAYKHGRYTAEAIANRREIAALLRVMVCPAGLRIPFQATMSIWKCFYNEQIFVVAGRQSRWVGRRKIKLAELVDEPWSLPTPESFAGVLLTEAFQASGLPAPRVNAGPIQSRFTMPCSQAGISSA